MRRSIRLTGRKQLAVSDFHFELRDVGGHQLITLGLPLSIKKDFPEDARVRVKLTENKRVSICDFGTIGDPKPSIDVGDEKFDAPSCQIRIASRGSREGLLLGSTPTWTYRTGGAHDGILVFQTKAIAPRLWDLDIRDEEYPIIYLDERIPDASNWAGTSPVFGALVFPAAIRDIFRHIIISQKGERPDDGWMCDWVKFADGLLGPVQFPDWEDEKALNEWIDRLVDSFLDRHQLSSSAIEMIARAA